MTRPLRVFLCHASQDKPAVRKLHRYLKQHGIEPWLDEIDLLPGENWEVEIPRAIDDSDVILVCLSKNSINKEGYVQKEISFALDKALEKPDGTIFIIPAKLEDCEVPKRLNRYQWVDLFRPDSNKRLLLGLNKRALSLGSDVSPVILEDTRQRKPASKPVESDPVDREVLEKTQRETAERLAREKAALETAEQEKQEREKVEWLAREQKEREAAEKAAFEEAKKEKQEREQVLPPVGRVSNPTIKTDEKASRAAYPFGALSPTYKDAPAVEKKLAGAPIPASKLNVRSLGISGIVFACLLLAVFGGNYLFNQIDSPVTTIPASATEFIADITESSMPDPGIGSTKNGVDGMVLVYVPEGEFTMGSDPSDQSDERPEHQVYLDAFWIDQTEVTNEKYALCVNVGDCEAPRDTDHFTNSGYANHPVIYISWDDALAYCTWVDRRLPTEAEWEKAARGTDGRQYPWGDQAPDSSLLNYNSEIGETTEVGNYPSGVSSYGAFDMAGNVWEWVNDWYSANYYATSPLSNPQGPTSGQYRVLRGGSWNFNDFNVRSSNRNWVDPSDTDYYVVGFRCSLSHP